MPLSSSCRKTSSLLESRKSETSQHRRQHKSPKESSSSSLSSASSSPLESLVDSLVAQKYPTQDILSHLAQFSYNRLNTNNITSDNTTFPTTATNNNYNHSRNNIQNISSMIPSFKSPPPPPPYLSTVPHPSPAPSSASSSSSQSPRKMWSIRTSSSSSSKLSSGDANDPSSSSFSSSSPTGPCCQDAWFGSEDTAMSEAVLKRFSHAFGLSSASSTILTPESPSRSRAPLEFIGSTKRFRLPFHTFHRIQLHLSKVRAARNKYKLAHSFDSDSFSHTSGIGNSDSRCCVGDIVSFPSSASKSSCYLYTLDESTIFQRDNVPLGYAMTPLRIVHTLTKWDQHDGLPVQIYMIHQGSLPPNPLSDSPSISCSCFDSVTSQSPSYLYCLPIFSDLSNASCPGDFAYKCSNVPQQVLVGYGNTEATCIFDTISRAGRPVSLHHQQTLQANGGAHEMGEAPSHKQVDCQDDQGVFGFEDDNDDDDDGDHDDDDNDPLTGCDYECSDEGEADEDDDGAKKTDLGRQTTNGATSEDEDYHHQRRARRNKAEYDQDDDDLTQEISDSDYDNDNPRWDEDDDDVDGNVSLHSKKGSNTSHSFEEDLESMLASLGASTKSKKTWNSSTTHPCTAGW